MKDVLGRDFSKLRDKKLFLFDMDGTIYRENTLFDGVTELLNKIKEQGGAYAFITNNPSKSVKDYLGKLNAMGVFGLDETNFFTSAQATIELMKEQFSNALIYVQGTHSFVEELKENGIRVTESYTPTASAVLVAFDPEVTGEKLRNTCKMLTLHDIPYYATNPDWVCPVDFGAIPDCGCLCFAIEKATGKQPIFIGKPEPTMIFNVMRRFGVSPSDTVVVGDRLYTDVASGARAGVDTVCVLSGEATLKDVRESDIQPTFVLESVKNLLER